MESEQRVSVLRVIARLNVGGPARHVVWLNEALAAKGFETLLVTGTVPAGEDDIGFPARARICAFFEECLAHRRRERP